MPSAIASTDSVNSSREPVRATCSSSQGTTRLPTTRTSARNRATLPSVSASVSAEAVAADLRRRGRGVAAQRRRRGPAAAPGPAPWPGPRRSASRRRCGRRPVSSALRSSSARSSTTVLATESARPKHEAGAEATSPRASAMRDAERRGDRDLRQRAGDGDPAHRQQVLDREVQADAEHQQDDADLGELARPAPASATKPGVNGPTATPASR